MDIRSTSPTDGPNAMRPVDVRQYATIPNLDQRVDSIRGSIDSHLSVDWDDSHLSVDCSDNVMDLDDMEIEQWDLDDMDFEEWGLNTPDDTTAISAGQRVAARTHAAANSVLAGENLDALTGGNEGEVLPVQTSRAIAALVEKNADGVLSTQDMLSQILNILELKGYEVEIQSDLNANLDTFTLPSAPGDIFYKLEVTYNLVVTKGGNPVDFDVGSEITKDIFTTATTPEEAIRAAQDFKETVVNLAFSSSNFVNPANVHLENYLELDTDDQNAVMRQKCFAFKYHYEEGTPTALLSIHPTERGQEGIELKMKSSGGIERRFDRDISMREERSSETHEREMYGVSDASGLLDEPYRLAQLQGIQRAIRKKEAEMDQIKVSIRQDLQELQHPQNKTLEELREIRQKMDTSLAQFMTGHEILKSSHLPVLRRLESALESDDVTEMTLDERRPAAAITNEISALVSQIKENRAFLTEFEI